MLCGGNASVWKDYGRKTKRETADRLLCDIARIVRTASTFSKEGMGMYTFYFGGSDDRFV